ncbi:MAG: trigger factor [Candidatus Binatia bacterium]
MKIDIDELSSVQRKVRVELPVETVASEFSRAYKNLGQRVRVKGFRTGKIPRSVLQGIYGDEVKGEVRSHLVEESLGEIIRERGLQIVSRPEVEANDLSEAGVFSFSAVFEVKPEISVKDYLGVEVERLKLAITDGQVDEAMRRLQENHARLEPVTDRDIVQKGDFVALDFDGAIDGKPFSGGKGENYTLEVGAGQAPPQFEGAVTGLKVNERQTVQVNYPEDYPNKEIAGKAVDFSLVVREIKQKVLPVLDDDFAKDHGECASLDELKGRIRARLTDELKRYQDEDLKEKIISRLIESHSFAAPPSMIERQTRYLMERYQNQVAQSGADAGAAPPMEEARKTLEPRAMRQVQATLLMEKIAKLEKIEISDKEVQERIDHLARAAGERSKTVREVYSRPDARDDLRAQLVFDRTVDFLLERAQIKDVDLPPSKVDESGEKR